MTVAYDYPDFSNEPRLMLPIAFCSSSSTGNLLTPIPSSSAPKQLHHNDALTAIYNYLQLWPEDAKPPCFVLSNSASSASNLHGIILRERLGEGRTGTVWRVETDEQDTGGARRVAKVLSQRHFASFVRETCFYEAIFPLMTPPLPVAKFYGSYASVRGGWYVMLLEDVGSPVEGYKNGFLLGDKKSQKAIWCDRQFPLLPSMLHR